MKPYDDNSPEVRPVVAVLCCGRLVGGRAYQMVASRFIEPVVAAGGLALIVPAMPRAVDAVEIARRCDALLMTGSPSNLSPRRFGGTEEERDPDHDRDEVALAVASAMIDAGRPVLGICRGMQELAVLSGGTLRTLPRDGVHLVGDDWCDERVFLHRHEVKLACGGRLRGRSDADSVSVVSAHRQGVERLGAGLLVEAVAPDGLVEAFSSSPRSTVVGVQWHPELGSSPLDRSLFVDLLRAA